MYCVKCGRETEDLYEHLCAECFSASRAFVQFPGDVIIHSCRLCGRFEVLGQWQESSLEEALEAAVMEATLIENGVRLVDYRLDVEQQSDIHYSTALHLTLDIAGLTVEKEARMRVRHRETTCPVCQKVRSNYYEAIIQVRPSSGGRFRGDELEAISEDIRQRIDAGFGRNPDVFITKEEDMHGGRNFYIGNRAFAQRIARALVKAYGATYTESSSLWGMKEGKEIYRMTYLVRLPPYRSGDFIEKEKRIYLLKSFGSDRIHCTDLETWNEFSFDKSDRFRVIGGAEMVRSAVVVSESDKEVQVMDPEDYRTLDLKKPDGFSPADSVSVIRHEERLYLVPPCGEKEG